MYKIIEVEVEEIELENDDGDVVDSVLVRCSKCGHEVESFGTEEPSVLRGCAVLKEECPRNEKNFYRAKANEEYAIKGECKEW